MRRSAAVAVVPALGVLLLGGCSIPIDGRIGIARTGSGELQIVLHTCTTVMTVANLDVLPPEESRSVEHKVLGQWRVTEQPGPPTLVSWPLLGPSAGHVEATTEVSNTADLPGELDLAAFGDGYRADGPYRFTAADIDNLAPGTVLTSDLRPWDYEGPIADHAVVSQVAFEATDCTLYGN